MTSWFGGTVPPSCSNCKVAGALRQTLTGNLRCTNCGRRWTCG